MFNKREAPEMEVESWFKLCMSDTVALSGLKQQPLLTSVSHVLSLRCHCGYHLCVGSGVIFQCLPPPDHLQHCSDVTTCRLPARLAASLFTRNCCVFPSGFFFSSDICFPILSHEVAGLFLCRGLTTSSHSESRFCQAIKWALSYFQ